MYVLLDYGKCGTNVHGMAVGSHVFVNAGSTVVTDGTTIGNGSVSHQADIPWKTLVVSVNPTFVMVARQVWDLIPGGRDVAVTNASVISYIHLMAHFKLNVQTARPCKAFMKGFR